MLDAKSSVVPAPLLGMSDATRVGALGHSFGAATVGRLAQEDPRVRAAMPIATPIENPFFPGNKIADIHVPLLSILAEEDNSIGALGNNLIASNFKIANPPIRLVEVRDAGHWNFTDICGLTDGFSPGCGEGVRQTVPGEAFTYLDIEVGRGIARAYAVAFFDRYLRDATDAAAYLDAPDPADVVTVEVRE
jgi:predicted dienelactone hydrolase